MPDVVDDDEGRSVAEFLCQSGGGRCRTASEGGIVGQESPVDLPKALDDVRFLGVATEFDPDDAISKGGVDRLIVAEAALARVLLPKPPPPWIAVVIATGFSRFSSSSKLSKCLIFRVAMDVRSWLVGNHERCAEGRKWPALDVQDQSLPVAGILPKVACPDPGRQPGDLGFEVWVLGHHWSDVHTAVPRVPPLPSHPLGVLCLPGKDQKEKPNLVKCRENLGFQSSPPFISFRSNQVEIPSAWSRASSSWATERPSL